MNEEIKGALETDKTKFAGASEEMRGIKQAIDELMQKFSTTHGGEYRMRPVQFQVDLQDN